VCQGIGGFCNHHAYQLAAKSDALGTVILFAATMATRSRRGSDPRKGDAVSCPVCVQAGELEQRYLDTLLAFEDEPELREAFVAGPGLCLPHTEAVHAAGAPPWLLTFQRSRLDALRAEAQRFVDAANFGREDRGAMDPTLPARMLGAVAAYHGRPADVVRRSRR
jgi:hypothetical protein